VLTQPLAAEVQPEQLSMLRPLRRIVPFPRRQLRAAERLPSQLRAPLQPCRRFPILGLVARQGLPVFQSTLPRPEQSLLGGGGEQLQARVPFRQREPALLLEARRRRVGDVTEQPAAQLLSRASRAPTALGYGRPGRP
jgi:hypothetical protein